MHYLRPVLTSLLLTTALSQPIKGSTERHISHRCATEVFGQPDAAHCKDLLQYIFVAEEPSPSRPSFSDPLARMFDTEELRAKRDTGDWPGTFKLPLTDIVQLPKLYTRRTCNIGIYPYHEPEASRGYGNVLGSWDLVRSGTDLLMKNCVSNDERGNSGGETYIFSETQSIPVLTVFIWASGATEFEDRLNQYESDPTTVLQVGGHWFWDAAAGSNSTLGATGNSTLAQGSPIDTTAMNFTNDVLGLELIDWTGQGGNGTVLGAAMERQNGTTDPNSTRQPSTGNLPGGPEGAGVAVATF